MYRGLYYWRNDTKLCTFITSMGSPEENFALFTEADLGKTIPVYIGTTPPLGIKAEACNCDFFEGVAA